MNRFAKNIVIAFNAQGNREYLLGSLQGHYGGNPTVNSFLKMHGTDLISTFSVFIEKELYFSDPIESISTPDHLNCFNNQFIMDRISYINTHVLQRDDPPIYTVNDGIPTSRHNPSYLRGDGDNTLGYWKQDAGRGLQTREDPSSDTYKKNTFHSMGQITTGITFCDQSQLNTSPEFNTQYMESLNKCNDYLNTPFGNATRTSDERLLSRRSFRRNEAGIENAVPRYEQRLQRRNIERDVREGSQGTEMGCMVAKHNMEPLHCRMGLKTIAMGPVPCDRPGLNLHAANPTDH